MTSLPSLIPRFSLCCAQFNNNYYDDVFKNSTTEGEPGHEAMAYENNCFISITSLKLVKCNKELATGSLSSGHLPVQAFLHMYHVQVKHILQNSNV